MLGSMPIRQSRIQFLLVVSHAALALAVVLTACSSPATPGRTGAAPKSRVPDHYDAAVVMCPAPPATPPCAGRASAAELSAVRRRLLRDPAVRSIAAISAAAAYRIAQLGLTAKVARRLRPGHLPAAFSVALDAPFGSFAARYRRLPGVQDVVPCRTGAVICRIDLLRAVGVIH
jgi:hypothetical protein